MQLNCKPGDLAVVVRSRNADNIGKVVRVIQAVDPRTKLDIVAPNGWPVILDPYHAWWEIDTPVTLSAVTDPSMVVTLPFIVDASLRPLRDNDEPDETLHWAGIPRGNVRSTLDALHRALTGEGLR